MIRSWFWDGSVFTSKGCSPCCKGSFEVRFLLCPCCKGSFEVRFLLSIIWITCPSGLTLADLDSVEVVGGSCRIPMVKEVITDVFKRETSTTLNLDEAVARGCCLQCAILSPSFKVHTFVQVYIHTHPLWSLYIVWRSYNTFSVSLGAWFQHHRHPAISHQTKMAGSYWGRGRVREKL